MKEKNIGLKAGVSDRVFRRPFSQKSRLKFERFVCGPLENNVYLVFDEEKKVGLIIDPALGSNVVSRRAKELGLKIELVLNTHGHADHTVEDAFIKKETGARLAIHELDRYRLEENSRILTPYLQVKPEPVTAEQTFKDNDKIVVGSVELLVVHTPGHTEGSSCFFAVKEKVLFSGDTLFRSTHGRTDLGGGNAEQIKKSLKKLFKTLPMETKVFPGHGEPTTIGAEKWIEEI